MTVEGDELFMTGVFGSDTMLGLKEFWKKWEKINDSHYDRLSSVLTLDTIAKLKPKLFNNLTI